MWKTVKLGELYKIGSSKRVLKADWKTEGVPFYRGREITLLSADGYIDNDLFISDQHYQSLSKKSGVPVAGDIMVTAIGTIGNTYLVEPNHKFYFKDASVLWLKKKAEVSSEYIQYWLKADDFFSQLDKGNGATVDTLTIKKLASVVIQLPPLAEQQRIVAKLDAAFAEIDRAIEVAESKHTEVEKLKASLLSSLLRGEDWETVKLGEVCELAYGKALDKTDRLESSGYPAYGANGIKTQSKKALYDKPSIIIGRKGSAGEINKVFEPFWALDVTYYAKIDDNIITLDYLFYALITLNLPSLARGVKPGINRNDVYQQTIPLPSLAEQQRIVAKLDAAFAEIDRANSSVLEAKAHFQALKSAILAQELQPPQSEAA